MIIQNPPKILTDEFFCKKFANRFLTEKRIIRLGNIISFLSPVELTIDEKSYKSDLSINFCIEIPDITVYSGVCFQKLFLTNVANILGNQFLNSPIELLNNDIVVKCEHKNQGINQLDGVVSLSNIKLVNNSILMYIGLYNIAGDNSSPRAFSLNFEVDKSSKIMDTVNENFYYLAHNIFVLTSKI